MDSPPTREPLRGLALALACVLVVLATHARALALPFLCDDWFLIYEAGRVREPLQQFGFGWEAFHQWVRPVALASFRAQAVLNGPSPLAHHAVNLLLHAVAAWFLGWTLYLRSGMRFEAWAAALLFAVFPLNVEAVAWISARSDLLCGLFCLAALGCALRYVESGRSSIGFATAACTLLALGSKESALALPLLFALVLRRGESAQRRRRNTVLVASVGLTLSYLGLRWWLLGGFGGYVEHGENAHFVGGALDAWERLVNTALALACPLQRGMLPPALGFARWMPPALLVCAIALGLRKDVRVSAALLLRYLALYLATMATLATWWGFEGSLRGQRSLYLPAAVTCSGLALALACITRSSALRWSLLALLGLPFAWASRAALDQWRAGGELSERVLATVCERALSRSDRPCWFVVGAPDSLGPAFVFRNGLTQAVWLRLGAAYEVYPLVAEEQPWFSKSRDVRERYLRRTYSIRAERALECLEWDGATATWLER